MCIVVCDVREAWFAIVSRRLVRLLVVPACVVGVVWSSCAIAFCCPYRPACCVLFAVSGYEWSRC